MKKLIFNIALLSSVFADSNFNMVVDPYLSPYIGAENLLTAHELIEKSKVGQLPTALLPQNSNWSKIGRFSELFFFWDPINYLSIVAQHEVFGHGYRVRSLTPEIAQVENYKFGIPTPYGRGGGATHYRFDPSRMTTFENLAIASGGMEANAIFAHRLRFQWLKSGHINPLQSSLYLLSEHDSTRYALLSTNAPGDDIANYIHVLNRTYPKGHLTLKSLKKTALINLLDPLSYYSLFSWHKYVTSGKQGPIPMIPLGSYKYLPSFRMGLTPFGPEYYVENFLVKDKKPFYFYVRGGTFAGMRYTGVGIEHPHLWEIGSVPIGFRLDAWLQPAIDFSNRRYSISELIRQERFQTDFDKSKVGVAFSVIAQKKLWSHGSFFVQVGGKTQGFVPGEELKSSAILRVGLTLW